MNQSNLIHLQFQDYSDLISLFVGVCFAASYFTEKKQKRTHSFLGIIEDFAKPALIYLRFIEKRILRLLLKAIFEFDYISSYLSGKSKIKHSDFEPLMKRVDHYGSLANKMYDLFKQFIHLFSAARHLGFCSLLIGIYGVFIMVISGIHGELDGIYNFMFVTNVFLLILTAISIIAEFNLMKFKIKSNHSLFRQAIRKSINTTSRLVNFAFHPKVSHPIYGFIILFILFYVLNTNYINANTTLNRVVPTGLDDSTFVLFTLFVLFSSFILYFFVTFSGAMLAIIGNVVVQIPYILFLIKELIIKKTKSILIRFLYSNLLNNGPLDMINSEISDDKFSAK